jgi:lysophospholipase L1-like esterase
MSEAVNIAPPKPALTWRKRVLFGLIVCLIVLAGLELFLQIFACFSMRASNVLFAGNSKYSRMWLPDDKLGHRPNKYYPGHDAKGFHNLKVPDSATIVAMGDSQTYGIGADRMEDAWPQQLAKLTGISTYNMAFGMYGPGHSLLLLDEALALRPKLVIEAFYSGNDLYDGFALVHNKGKLPHLKSADPAVLAAIKSLEDVETLDHMSYRTSDRLEMLENLNLSKAGKLRAFFAENSAVYGLLRAAVNAVRKPRVSSKPQTWEAIKAEFGGQKDVYQPFECPLGRTVLMSSYRLIALNQRDARIQEGLRIQLAAIREMKKRLDAEHVRFVVLLIPTTEHVFAEQVKKSGDPVVPDYFALLENETLFWSKVRAALDAESIPYVEAAPALRAALARGAQPYPMDANGHPNAIGYGAIAAELAEKLKETLSGLK